MNEENLKIIDLKNKIKIIPDTIMNTRKHKEMNNIELHIHKYLILHTIRSNKKIHTKCDKLISL